MFILLTGQHGTCHNTVTRKLAAVAQEYAEAELGQPTGQPFLKCFKIEDQLAKLGYPPPQLLELKMHHFREDLWRNACEAIFNQYMTNAAGHHLLSLHMVHYWNRQFHDPVDWSHLLLFQPTVIVTLVDDIDRIWRRIQGSPGIPKQYVLEELLDWRAREISESSSLAKRLYVRPRILRLFTEGKQLSPDVREFNPFLGHKIPHFVISVQQNIKTLFNLLFRRRQYMRVYPSFPIGYESAELDARPRIDAWRKQLHDRYVVFDPLGIDENRVHTAPHGTVSLKDRWAFGIGEPIVPDPIDPAPTDLVKELRYLNHKIAKQIEARDLQLITQADVNAQWRPMLGRHVRQGMRAEAEYAANIDPPKALFSYHPEEDHFESVFSSSLGVHRSTEDEVLQLLDTYQRHRWRKPGDETWERPEKERSSL